MKKINLKKGLIKVLLISLITLLLVNSILTFLNGNIIVENNVLRERTELVKKSTSEIITDILHGADLGVRGYALTKNEKLIEPLTIVMHYKDSVFNKLKRQLEAEQYDTSDLEELRSSVNEYLALSNDMITMVRQDSVDKVIKILNEDRGYALWQKYKAFYEPLLTHEDTLNNEAQERYLTAVTNTRIIVIVLMLIGIPTLIYIMVRLSKDEKQLSRLLLKLDDQNRQYIFDSGTPLDVNDIDHVVENSIQNFQKANGFITNISAGNYSVEWEMLNDVNHSLNERNLAGNLIRMRDHLNQSKIDNERREWSASGLAELLALMQNQRNIKELGNIVVKYMVQYTKSNQACLFIEPVENDNTGKLELVSCYAWDKTRYINMTIGKHEGLVGQCWFEEEPILLAEVPQDYIQIASGLGNALPRCLYLAPIKSNDVIYGVLELASFNRFEQFEIDFINKACENIAACLFAVRITQKTDLLLSQYTDQIESLKSEIIALKERSEVL
ncbi:CHASE3 domain-containing protein [Ohtaekwangia sp.]|uniref:CHASE3 domain-containing protein n=1 Tax=Ohtaekwangia sp. TaxID=2066019 RepID=UPI002FDF0516